LFGCSADDPVNFCVSRESRTGVFRVVDVKQVDEDALLTATLCSTWKRDPFIK
jgi:hypothetical protein